MDTAPSTTQDLEKLRSYLSTYYGRVLTRTEDLEQKACCVDDTRSRYAEVVDLIPEEVKQRNYGCGCTIPRDDLRGLTVLDLGSGAGLDAFIAAYLVGESGQVIGVDMTDEQLDVARRNVEPVMNAFGFARANVEFRKGYIETLDSIESASVDLVISDCVINLSPLKDKVFEAMYRVLRPGGEFYISDIVADRRVPEALRNDSKLVAECLGGAPYDYDLLDIMHDAGFGDPRTVSRKLVEEDVAGYPIRFYSSTIRGFKLTTPFDRRCEDFGQVAYYGGNCAEQPARFTLDDHHVFESGKPVAVCRNSARMLSETRLRRYFEVTPPRQHLGIFDCSGPSESDSGGGAACC